VGTLEFRAVLEPIRNLQRKGDLRFYQGWADDVDLGKKTIRVEVNAADDASGTVTLPPPVGAEANMQQTPRSKKGELFDISYDKLVIAVGAYSQTFGIEGVRQHASFLRDIGDARRIRLRVLSLFEQCSYPSDRKTSGDGREQPLSDDDKRALLHFAIVGGGPTGIEFAAELHDLIHEDLVKIYPELVPLVRITVYDIAPKILPMFDTALSKYAMGVFARQKIEVKTEHRLERIRLADGELGARHGGLRIKIKENGGVEEHAGMVVWSTGLMQNPLVEKLVNKQFTPADRAEAVHLQKDAKTGGIVTDAYLRAKIANANPDNKGANVDVLDDVFVVGDCAVLDTVPSLPRTAQVASQEALHLAKMLNGGDVTGKAFEFRNYGTMTYLGSWKAIHQSSSDELKGWVAWVLWRGAYLTKSMSIRNKICVPLYWLMTWLFGRDISRF
jgi:NADH dehydrogenase FAD-containing subunit